VSKQRLFLLPNSFWLAQFFLVVQQIIVASSSVWITRLIVHISEGQPVLLWLWLYLASLILPYLPGAFALIEITKAQAKIVVNYVQEFAQRYPGKIVEWSNRQQRSKKSSILSGEAYPTLTSYVDYLYHLSSSALNVFFNLLALSILVDASLVLSYGCGIFLASLLLYFQKRSKERLSLKAQQSRIRWISLLLLAWDNILLNNSYNFRIWNHKSLERGKRLIGKAVQLGTFSQFVSIAMAFALIFPSIILVIYLAYTHIHDLPFLAVLVVVLPRLFQVLTFSYELLFLVADLPMQKAKLKTVLALLDDSENKEEAQDMLDRIDWEKIDVVSHEPMIKQAKIEPKELLQALPATGRMTLHGENGSGKTSLLLAMKIKHGKDAFYLPSKHELLFMHERRQASTGQLSRQILEELASNIEAPVILLDEWDANLDRKNKQEISSLIDTLALNRCVVEVLHQKHDIQ